MFDFTLALNDAVLPVPLPNDSMPSVGQADDPNNPSVPKPTKVIFLAVLEIGQAQDTNPPGKPPQGIFLSALEIGQLPNDSMPSVGQAGDPTNPSVPPTK